MKTTLLAGLALFSLASCSKSGSDPAPTPADQLQGHWQAETLHSVVYDATGKVVSDDTRQQVTKLDVTANTMSFTGVTAGGTPTSEVNAYTRSGELITYVVPAGTNPGKETVYARSLTATNFTLEFNGPRVAGKTYYIQSFPFHR